MTKCPACLDVAPGPDYAPLSRHLLDAAERSDPAHVRWLNQNVSRLKLTGPELTGLLAQFFDLDGGALTPWIKRRFIEKFYGAKPHPFVVALQHPSRHTLAGYVVEHQHFLRQWVRSCAYIMARTDRADVILYELDNLNTEFGGSETTPAHYELLLRMGEALGLRRADVLATPALPATERAIKEWDRICAEGPWVSAMAAMHGLELIASRTLVADGATVHYFDPQILDGSAIPPAAKAFPREGYEADVGHSEAALALVDRYAIGPGAQQDVQATFARSIDLFDDYLIARLERGDSYEG